MMVASTRKSVTFIALVIAFAINMLFFGCWCAVFRNKMNPQAGGSRLFPLIVSLQLLAFMLVSPAAGDANTYALYASINSYGGFEPGWGVLSSMAWSIWPHVKSLVAVSGGLLLLAFAHFAWHNSTNMGMTYLAFICFGFWGMAFHIFRQTVALAFTLVAYEFVKRRSPLKFVISVLLAFSFHETAILFLLLYPISRFERNAQYHVVAMLCGSVLLLFSEPILNILFLYGRNVYSLTELSGVNFFLLLSAILVFASVVWKGGKNDPTMHALEASAVLQVLAFRFSIFTRAVRFFSISAVTVIPNALECIKEPRDRLVANAVAVALLLVYYFLVLNCAYPGTLEEWAITIF